MPAWTPSTSVSRCCSGVELTSTSRTRSGVISSPNSRQSRSVIKHLFLFLCDFEDHWNLWPPPFNEVFDHKLLFKRCLQVFDLECKKGFYFFCFGVLGCSFFFYQHLWLWLEFISKKIIF